MFRLPCTITLVLLCFYLMACSRADPPTTSTSGRANFNPPPPTLSPLRQTPTPTPAVDLALDQVTLALYNHSSQAFSIRYPETWEVVERPDGVVFVSPQAQGRLQYFIQPG